MVPLDIIGLESTDQRDRNYPKDTTDTKKFTILFRLCLHTIRRNEDFFHSNPSAGLFRRGYADSR